MFPVPVGATNAAAQQFGAFRHHQQSKIIEQDDPTHAAREELQSAEQRQHEGDIEAEVDEDEVSNTARFTLRNPSDAANLAEKPLPPSLFISPDDEKAVVPSPASPSTSNRIPTLHSDGSTAGVIATLSHLPPPSLEQCQSTLNSETLHLASISDPDIRKALDPAGPVGLEEFMQWPGDRLMALVDQVQMQHLPVMMKRRWQVHQQEAAKRLSFNNLSYTKDGDTILHDVSAYMDSGMLVGVLGAPDSGITPLFNVLTGRQQRGTLTGEILYDGKPRDAEFKALGGLRRERRSAPRSHDRVRDTAVFRPPPPASRHAAEDREDESRHLFKTARPLARG